MSREKAYMDGRIDGLTLALEIVRKGGLEALEEEMRYRNQTGYNVALTKKELQKLVDKMTVEIGEHLFDKCVIVGVCVLHDEFDFDHDQIIRFVETMGKAAHLLSTGEAEWNDYIKGIEEEINISLEIRHMN